MTDDGQLVANITNLQNFYDPEEFVRLRTYVRRRDYEPASTLTASLSPLGAVVSRTFYRVVNDFTQEVVIPFGTGSASENTRLSYDVSGSYFDFYMSNLPSGPVYRFDLLFDVNGRRRVYDGGWKFRVS